MIEPTPPQLATWLLKKCGSPYHGDSLAGDLIEQYREGRSRRWYWKQITAAILIARVRAIRTLPWTAVRRVLSRLLAETAAVLALVVIVDQVRRTRSLAEMMNHTFGSTLIVLLAVAVIGFLVSLRPDKPRQGQAAINVMMLAFGVIALGVGTLTWADTARGDSCRTAACVCLNK